MPNTPRPQPVFWTTAAAIVLLGAGGPALAQPAQPLFECWDQTFNYTVAAVVTDAEAGGPIVRLESQNPAIFAPMFPDLDASWGLRALEVPFAPAACTVNAETQRFTCSAPATLQSLSLQDEKAGSAIASVQVQSVRAILYDTVDVEEAVLSKTFVLSIVDANGQSHAIIVDKIPSSGCTAQG